MECRFALLVAGTFCFAWSALVGLTAAQDVPQVSLDPLSVSNETPSGDELMERVVQRIGEHESISAQIRHRTDLFGQRLFGSGSYFQRQAEQGVQVRFSLSVRSGERMVSLLHVCDGRFLWMHDNLGVNPSLVRVDLLRVRSAVGDEGVPLPVLAGGGLPQLLASLRRHFVVSRPQPIVFKKVPVWALACRWNPKQLAASVGRPDLVDEQGNLRLKQLPEQIPDQVFLLVGQDDLFPYHIDFRRSIADESISVLPGERSESRSLVTMELYEVQFGVPLDPLLFVYKPGSTEVDDQTDEFVVRAKAEQQRP